MIIAIITEITQMAARDTPSQNNPQVRQEPLQAFPVQPWKEFSGYLHKKDPTLILNNQLTYPTINVFMPDGDKIVPRGGELLFPQDNVVVNSPIIGHFKKYQNVGGIEMEIRVWNDNSMTLTGIAGVFVIGETITGGTSGATALVANFTGSIVSFSDLVGTFAGGETVTGGTSGATGTISVYKGDVIEVLYQGGFKQITPNINTLQKGVSRIGSTRIYYFDQWIDTDLDQSKSVNINRAVFVMGLPKIRSWTGGIAPVVSVVANVSVTTTAGVSWSSQGFPAPANGGSPNIVVNGVSYVVSSGWGTDTLLLANTVGIVAGNTAYSGIIEVSTIGNVIFDYMSAFKNYCTYGNWKLQKFYIANNFNRDATQNITKTQAVQNDLVLDNSNYTGTGSHVYRITIDSATNIQEFISGGGGNLNDGVYNTTGYTGTPGVLNIYSIVMVGDYGLRLIPVAGSFQLGETVRGSVSLAEGTVVYSEPIIGVGILLGIRQNTVVGFATTDTITGLSSAATATVDVADPNPIVFLNFFSGIKNGVIFNTNTGVGLRPVSVLSNAAITLIDGLTITFGQNNGHTVGDSFQLTINNTGSADTFQWQIDGAVPVATHVPITGASQLLSLGVSITFVSKQGHTLGDFWEITVFQSISNAYANFYYSLPRRPGEGYIGNLPANFWTMKPQEDLMYVNDASGKWGTIGTRLSADLQTETIEFDPLKSKGRNKVIFPYMIGYRDNNICYVTEDKNLDMIGREPLLQLPQITHLSDDVKLDFTAASFENGSIEWNSLRLFITSPEQLLMFVYDESMGYWQPPQLIPENGILSEVGLDLISHSSITNTTNTLFVETNDNGQPYPIKIRTGYNVYGNRWQEDVASMMFIEGYMEGNPLLKSKAILNVNGCGGIIQSTVLEPVYCRASDKAPFGYGSLGSHSLGSDEPSPLPYFQWIGIGQKPFPFYMAAMEIECSTLDPEFEILSLALNTVMNENNNGKLKRGQLELI